MARVLIVEDDPSIRKANAGLIRSFGHTPMTAVDGIEARRLIDIEKPFDLIICDQNMPRLRGLDLLRVLRGKPETYNIPFILYADAAGDPTAECKALNAVYLKKPGELIPLIEAALAGKQ